MAVSRLLVAFNIDEDIMRKKVVCFALILGFSVFGSLSGQTFKYDHPGFGFQFGLTIPDGVHPVEIGFNVGGHGDMAFLLGRAGEFHYVPGIDFWFGGDHDVYDHDYFAFEMDLNIADGRYYFPLPGKVRPFVGLGPCVSIHLWKWEQTETINNHPEAVPYHDWSAQPGFNFLGGVDFRVTSSTALYCEMRGKAGGWDFFKLLAGMTFAL
jgi:hypothetical protein